MEEIRDRHALDSALGERAGLDAFAKEGKRRWSLPVPCGGGNSGVDSVGSLDNCCMLVRDRRAAGVVHALRLTDVVAY
jgi:hypothetical protein